MHRSSAAVLFARQALRTNLSSRSFHTSPPLCNVLFNLNGLAGSRESQYLSKERGIPRTEYSSNLHLIRSSEVDPFAPAPGASKSAAASRGAQQDARRALEAERARGAVEAATALRGSFGHERPYGQKRRLDELSAELLVARLKIERLEKAFHKVDGNVSSTFLLALLFPLCAVAAYAIFPEVRDAFRLPRGYLPDWMTGASASDGPAGGAALAEYEKQLTLLREENRRLESLRFEELNATQPGSPSLASDGTAPGEDSAHLEGGRQTRLGRLLWANGSAAN